MQISCQTNLLLVHFFSQKSKLVFQKNYPDLHSVWIIKVCMPLLSSHFFFLLLSPHSVVHYRKNPPSPLNRGKKAASAKEKHSMFNHIHDYTLHVTIVLPIYVDTSYSNIRFQVHVTKTKSAELNSWHSFHLCCRNLSS